jgi:hypothetical protein
MNKKEKKEKKGAPLGSDNKKATNEQKRKKRKGVRRSYS